jgi:hypothetical protein
MGQSLRRPIEAIWWSDRTEILRPSGSVQIRYVSIWELGAGALPAAASRLEGRAEHGESESESA